MIHETVHGLWYAQHNYFFNFKLFVIMKTSELPSFDSIPNVPNLWVVSLFYVDAKQRTQEYHDWVNHQSKAEAIRIAISKAKAEGIIPDYTQPYKVLIEPKKDFSYLDIRQN